MGTESFLSDRAVLSEDLQAALLAWQPIETAPKTGRILVFNPFFGVYSSEYTVEREYLGHDDMRPNSERPIKWEGYPLGLTSIGLGKWYCVPTHWMPMPGPPSEPAALPKSQLKRLAHAPDQVAAIRAAQDRKLMQDALAVISWHCFGECRVTPGTPPIASNVAHDLRMRLLESSPVPVVGPITQSEPK